MTMDPYINYYEIFSVSGDVNLSRWPSMGKREWRSIGDCGPI
jgi:hypothetical protein